ncbi:C40 family peptidase [Roseburia sp. NSJ-9]|uniref:C40 family peptidase n=1 Tax=Roseburia lenta TaxID=2763061 RepID=A0ABR7GHD0_9FIRM|nr:C40 family peptidase [Roseburia lenta]MBC5686613.1 C40 family peptidase [Roseburia lenta]
MKKITLHKGGRGVLAVCLAGSMLFTRPMQVSAVRSISEIEEEQSSIQSELNGLDADMVSLVTDMTDLESQITSKTQEIADAEATLAEAQAAVDQQYASMKVRIQYMYENSDENIMTVLLESGSISDFLNRLENINAVYTYDRTVLGNYQAAKDEVEDLKASLEEEKASLEANKTQLANQQAQLNAMISEKQGEMADIKSELADAKALAARQAELERQRQLAALTNNTNSSNNGGSGNTGGNTGGSTNSGGNLNPSNTTGVSGSAVVAFANQYVGYPYVWGGTDPNTGADCSGFVYYVLKNFGINYGRLTSYGWRSVGQEVSVNNMQPGDIVCYAGHVAIYAGGGRIVEAQSTSAGITNNRSVYCHNIITVRRVL